MDLPVTSDGTNGLVFVLVRPRRSGNVGSVARALKNSGFAGLRVVGADPRTSRVARVMAVRANDVLEGAGIFSSLADALADCSVVAGTTARAGLYRSGAITPREIAPDLTSLARTNRVAILFGPEDRGLTNVELKQCQRLIKIPSDPVYPSLNLAQAVMIVAYEMRLAAIARQPAGELPAPRAGAAEVDAMFERLSRALLAIGFLPEDNPDHIMFAIREMFGRTGVRPRELDILNGISRQIEWFGAGGYRTVENKRRTGRRIR